MKIFILVQILFNIFFAYALLGNASWHSQTSEKLCMIGEKVKAFGCVKK